MLITATEITSLATITASAATIAAGTWIQDVQERVSILTNNYFPTGLRLYSTMTFNATANTVVADSSFADENILAGDTVHIDGSYRNDGFHDVSSVTTVTMTLTSATSVVDELSGASIIVSVVKWPRDVKKVAAQMIAYDYDVRPSRVSGVKSFSIGPYSETAEDSEGYPTYITEHLNKYRVVNLI